MASARRRSNPGTNRRRALSRPTTPPATRCPGTRDPGDRHVPERLPLHVLKAFEHGALACGGGGLRFGESHAHGCEIRVVNDGMREELPSRFPFVNVTL